MAGCRNNKKKAAKLFVYVRTKPTMWKYGWKLLEEIPMRYRTLQTFGKLRIDVITGPASLESCDDISN